MRFWTVIIVMSFLVAIELLRTPALAADAKRVALVIGNSKYVNAVHLPNPANDAHLIASTLGNAGFDVIEGVDQDNAGMHRLISRFTEESYNADLAVIFFAGHGMQVDGKNYLIPVDAELTSPAYLKTRTVQIDEFMAALPPDPAVGIIILDACRDNPLARTLAAALPKTRSLGSGLAPVEAKSDGVGSGGLLIAYATDPGAVSYDGNGIDSPYSLALAKHLTEPGVEIQSALTRVRGEVTEATEGRQRPWHNASLGREVFLGSPPTQAAQSSTTQASTEPQGTDSHQWAVEQRVWDEASKRNELAYYETYIDQFPKGAFADLARLNIARLKRQQSDTFAAADPNAAVAAEPRVKSASPEIDAGTELTESAIGLSRQQKIDLQERLLAIGYDLDEADGDLGIKTRQAIRKWQEENQFPPSAFLTDKQYLRIKLDTQGAVDNYRARRDSMTNAKKQDRKAQQSSASAKPRNAAPAMRTKSTRQRPAAPETADSSPPNRVTPERKFRSCGGRQGFYQVPASQKCPLDGRSHADNP